MEASQFVAITGSPFAEKRVKSMSALTEEEARWQAEFLARDMLEYLLKEKEVRINGYRKVKPGKLRDVEDERPSLRTGDFQRVRKSIIEGSNYIMGNHGQELIYLCERLDMRDEQLHSNFVELLDRVWEQPQNWGRLVSLFVAAYYICERLHKEGSDDKIESVIGWLAGYLKAHVVPWVVARGGFTGVLYGTHTPGSKSKSAESQDCKSDYNSARMGLVGLALGLGAAVVVGTIVGR